ncbi:hypothetical protein MRX96_025818 [Rhipicephalus microplus]
MDCCCDALFSDHVLLQDSCTNVHACHAHLVMKEAAVQTNPAKTTIGQVSSSDARQTKRAKLVANRVVLDQSLSSARHTKTAKPAATSSAAGQPYTPPCARSHSQQFEKQSVL